MPESLNVLYPNTNPPKDEINPEDTIRVTLSKILVSPSALMFS